MVSRAFGRTRIRCVLLFERKLLKVQGDTLTPAIFRLPQRHPTVVGSAQLRVDVTKEPGGKQ